MNVKRAVLAAAVLYMAPAAPIYAQAGGAAAPAAPQKIGIMNVRQAVFGTAEGKQALAELQSQFAPRTTELDNLRKQMDDIQKRLRDGERTLSDEEKARLTAQGQILSRKATRLQQDFEEDAQAAQGEVFDRIARKMDDVMNRYARENNYSLVIDVSSQQVIIYAEPKVDVTQDIIRLYDQAFPVRASAPANPQAQPGTPRPPAKQPPPTKPPQQ